MYDMRFGGPLSCSASGNGEINPYLCRELNHVYRSCFIDCAISCAGLTDNQPGIYHPKLQNQKLTLHKLRMSYKAILLVYEVLTCLCSRKDTV